MIYCTVSTSTYIITSGVLSSEAPLYVEEIYPTIFSSFTTCSITLTVQVKVTVVSKECPLAHICQKFNENPPG